MLLMTGLPSPEGVDAHAAGRERAFDLLRGLCIVSMVFAHLAAGSLLERVTHAPVWVDGAVGFVFISGLVLALTQRRTVDNHGLGTALGRVLRRIRMIYVANAAITFLAIVVGTFLSAHTEMPSAHRYGWSMSLLRVLLVAFNPPASVLGLYVFLMLGALGALTLLARRRTGLLLALSVVAYVGARLSHLDTSLAGHGQGGQFHVAGWQLLFVLGMVLGWHWRDRHLGRLLLERRVQVPALVLVVALTCLAHLVGHGVTSAAVATRLSSFFDKPTLAPGVLLFAVAILTVGYGAATWAVRSPVDRWLAPVTTIGRHSLDSYVIAMFATIVIPAVLGFRESGLFAQELAVAVLLAAYTWARFRERDRSHRGEVPHPAATADCLTAEGSLPPSSPSASSRN
jgi:hypothetical protein